MSAVYMPYFAAILAEAGREGGATAVFFIEMAGMLKQIYVMAALAQTLSAACPSEHDNK